MPKEREWRLRAPADPENVKQLSAELGVDPVLATLLVHRASGHLRKPARFQAEPVRHP